MAPLQNEIAPEKKGLIRYDKSFPMGPKMITHAFLLFGSLGDRFLSSTGAGENCALSMRLSSPSPVLDKNSAPLGPEILSSTGAGVWRKAPMAFSDSSSVLGKSQSSRVALPITQNICYTGLSGRNYFV